MAITDFRELALPDHTVGSTVTKWFVRISGVEEYYLLNHTNHLGSSHDYHDELYFSSELCACDAAYRFYSHHGKTYPHMSYLISLQADMLAALTKQSSDSQVMEFI